MHPTEVYSLQRFGNFGNEPEIIRERNKILKRTVKTSLKLIGPPEINPVRSKNGTQLIGSPKGCSREILFHELCFNVP